jgi:hypothetical protein
MMLASTYLSTYFDAVIDTGVTLTQEHMRAIVERVKSLEAPERMIAAASAPPTFRAFQTTAPLAEPTTPFAG